MAPVALVAAAEWLVAVEDDGEVRGLDPRTFAARWSRPAGPGPAVRVLRGGEPAVLVVTERGDGVVLGPADGALLARWRVPGCPGGAPHPHRAAAADGRAVIACAARRPPGLVALADAAAAQGLIVGVAEEGLRAVLVDATGTAGRAFDPVGWPFATGGGRLVAVREGRYWLGVHDLRSGTRSGACPHCYERGGYAVAVTPDGRQAAWSGYEKYGAGRDREFVRLVDLDDPEGDGRDVLRGESEYTDLLVTADGGLLVAGDAGGAVEVLPLAGGEPVVLGRVVDAVAALAQVDDRTVAAAGTGGELCAWRLPAVSA